MYSNMVRFMHTVRSEYSYLNWVRRSLLTYASIFRISLTYDA